MGIYENKQFLNLYDVIDYLDDNGFLNNSLTSYTDKKIRVKNILKSWFIEKKLQPVIYLQRECIALYEIPKDEEDYCENDYLFLDGYFSLSDIAIETLFKDDEIKLAWQGGLFKTFRYDEFGFADPYYKPYFLNKNSDTPNYEKTVFYNMDLAEDEKIIFDDFFYPKSQIDEILNTSYSSKITLEYECEINHLKTELEQAQARIAELERLSDNKELTANSQKAVTKLLYALLKEHEYELGAKKGTTNSILESLTAKHRVGISRETISKWLDMVNALDK